MQFLQSLSFGTPLALWGLLALPVIWWLLRFTPPRPQSIKFPPLRILLGLQTQEETPDKTPWWLLALRLGLAAALIFAVAQPHKNDNSATKNNSGPLLLIVDNGWAAAETWPKRLDALQSILDQAQNANRTVTLATTTPMLNADDFTAMTAHDAANKIAAMEPQALGTDRVATIAKLRRAHVEAAQVIWLSDGLDSGTAAKFVSDLQSQFGKNITALSVQKPLPLFALARPTIEGGDIKVSALRSETGPDTPHVQALAGDGRVLAETTLNFDGPSNATTAKINLPIELRNDIQSLAIAGQHHAGARQLLDDRWRRKTVAIQSSAANLSSQPLLSPLHYVINALQPYAEIQQPADAGELKTALDTGLSMLVLADIGNINPETSAAIKPWLEKGGVLLRFAGPHMAATTDDLLPVRLRGGDRNLGSSLSWETPQAIQSFSDKSPFANVAIDNRIRVTQQVLAEPDADLAVKTWVSLADGTPLVTAARSGKGLIVLFHVTANTDWSNLPLTGTFVEMLKQIVDLAPAAGSNTAAANTNTDVASSYALRLALAGNGELKSPTAAIEAISAALFDKALPSATTPPGIYARGPQERAVNLDLAESDLAPISNLPGGVALQSLTPPQSIDYAPPLFILAALLFLFDLLATLWLNGAVQKRSFKTIAIMILFFSAPSILSHVTSRAYADDQSNTHAALETHLAYVKTGDTEIDQTSAQGLKGLQLIIQDRTSASLGDAIGVNVESDELVFYPLLYWPIVASAQPPSDASVARLSSYMKNGGTIFFDLRDAGSDIGSNAGANSEALKRILAKFDIPALEPVPDGHALTRSFYLLKDWPGRYTGGAVWVETPSIGNQANSDGVSGLIIGSNDYAAAWAVDGAGQPLNAVIPGSEHQREMAYRVGVNVVMYTLTGNYKTDQVHVPDLLKKLEQQP